MPVSEQLRVALSDRYRIEREIGAGGMATVYIAEDVKHRRKVALKVLRPELAAVLGIERFLSEINVTANLQHPHLLPLFDSGEADGLLFYVMPYSEGESLRHRLERERQLPIDEAVRIAVAVLSALAYAHRHNVIHRDLKPENILLHEGQPLVTDFGIALAVSNAGGGRITQTGLSLGTPQYMSPEQATGDRNIDARSDVYSLGAVLYEMLVGDPPHWASTTQAVIAKVLTERPPSVRTYRDTVPEHVDAAVQCALAKLPADRFSSAAEFAEALVGTRAVVVARPARVIAERDVTDLRAEPTLRRRLMTWLPWGIAAAAVLGASALGLLRPDEPPEWPTAFVVAVPDSIQVETPAGVSFALSRDGAHLAFVGREQTREGIFLRRLDGVSAAFIRGTELGSNPVISPDGRELAFVTTGDGKLKKVALSGGSVMTLADSASTGVTWTERGDILYATRRAIRMVPATGGPASLLARTDTTLDHRRYGFLHALPGGKAALLTIWKGDVVLSHATIGVVSIPDGKVTDLGVPGTGANYLPHERVVVFGREGGTVLAAPFSLRKLRFTGPAQPVLDNVRVKGGGAMELAASDNGTLIYKASDNASGELTIVNRSGVEQRTIPMQLGGQPRVSADGRRILLYSATDRDVWYYDLAISATSRVTSNGRSQGGEWLDARRVVYVRSADSGGAPRLEVQRWDGSAPPDTFLAGPGGLVQIAVGPSGGYHVVRYSMSPVAPADLLLVPVDSPQSKRPLMPTSEDERSLSLSPDGRLLAYVSDRTGRPEVYVRPIPGPDERLQVSINGGEQPSWTPNGYELLYRGTGWFRSVTLATEPQLDLVRRDSLFPDRYARGNPNDANYDVFPDGHLVVLRSPNATTQFMGIANWKPTPATR